MTEPQLSLPIMVPLDVEFRDEEFLAHALAAWVRIKTGEDLPDAVGCSLVREPDHEMGLDAIAVWMDLDTGSRKIGYLPSPIGMQIAAAGDDGEVWVAAVAEFTVNDLDRGSAAIMLECRREDLGEWEGLPEVYRV